MNQGMEMSSNNKILSPPSSSAMSPTLKEEHELRTAQEMCGDHVARTSSSGNNNDQANKNLRGAQRTPGMPVSVVYQVINVLWYNVTNDSISISHLLYYI